MLFRYLDTIGPSVMNVICIVVPVIGFVVGLLRGFGNRGIRVIEGALIIFFSLLLKDPMSSILYRFVPFFDIDYKIVNILLYEFISYVIVAIILIVIFHLMNRFINVIDRIMGVIVGIGVPSGILGALVSFIEYTFYLYVFIFIVFFFSSITYSPIESSIANKIYYNMPVLRQVFGNSFDAYIEVGNKIGSNGSVEKVNHDSMEILLRYKFISKTNAKYLIDTKKITIKDSDKLLSRYK